MMVAVASILLAAVAAQARLFTARRGAHIPIPNLAIAVPSSLSGWSVRDLPLGTNEMAVRKTHALLNFDSFVFREFRHGGTTFEVYSAYWAPGRMPIQEVAIHSPDVCWKGNGWTCRAAQHSCSLRAGVTTLTGGEWRLFSGPQEDLKYVQFWHFLDGISFGAYPTRYRDIGSAWESWRRVVSQLFQPLPEQYFVRISSSAPLETFENDRGFQEIVTCIERLLRATSNSTD